MKKFLLLSLVALSAHAVAQTPYDRCRAALIKASSGEALVMLLPETDDKAQLLTMLPDAGDGGYFLGVQGMPYGDDRTVTAGQTQIQLHGVTGPVMGVEDDVAYFLVAAVHATIQSDEPDPKRMAALEMVKTHVQANAFIKRWWFEATQDYPMTQDPAEWDKFFKEFLHKIIAHADEYSKEHGVPFDKAAATDYVDRPADSARETKFIEAIAVAWRGEFIARNIAEMGTLAYLDGYQVVVPLAPGLIPLVQKRLHEELGTSPGFEVFVQPPP